MDQSTFSNRPVIITTVLNPLDINRGVRLLGDLTKEHFEKHEWKYRPDDGGSKDL
jgi:hypothetical protein